MATEVATCVETTGSGVGLTVTSEGVALAATSRVGIVDDSNAGMTDVLKLMITTNSIIRLKIVILAKRILFKVTHLRCEQVIEKLKTPISL